MFLVVIFCLDLDHVGASEKDGVVQEEAGFKLVIIEVLHYKGY
jgi:hypothetical protein